MSRGNFKVFLSGVKNDRPGGLSYSAGRPGQAVGLFAGVDVAGDFERFQIDDDDDIVICREITRSMTGPPIG